MTHAQPRRLVHPVEPAGGVRKELELWLLRSDNSINQLARKLNYSAAVLSEYLAGTYEGDIQVLEKGLKNLLRREAFIQVTDAESFRNTSAAREMWQVLQYCESEGKMGAIITESGLGKTTIAQKWRIDHHRTILVTASIVNQSPGQILGDIAERLHASTYPATTRRLFNSIVEHLKGYLAMDLPYFVLIDEAHFLAWDTFELLRTIHDEVRAGIVYLGMPRLLSEMKRNRRYLWDQILSRLSVSCSINGVTKEDVKLLIDSVFPDLPKSCLGYLYEKAQGPGKFRAMMELLSRVVHIHKIERIPVTAALIKEVDEQF